MNKPPDPQVAAPARKHGPSSLKFTPEARAKVVELVARGVPISHCAPAVGVCFQSLMNWRHRDPTFDAEIARAVAKAMDRRLLVIENALESADVNVRLRAATWHLEHVHAGHFSKSRLEITGADGGPLDARVAVLIWPHMQAANPKPHELTDANDADDHPAETAPDAD
jgi:transposase-like protein